MATEIPIRGTVHAGGPMRGSQADIDAAIIENKRFRVSLDGVLQEMKASPRLSPERSTAIRKIKEAIMWCGMDMKELNEGRSIYPESYNPANAIVEPTADGLKM